MRTMLLRTSVVVALSFAAAVQPPPSVLLALMVRDEEANLRANLPKWLGVADAIVVGVDERTRDGSALAVAESLSSVPRWVFYLRFEGFGAVRTRVFEEAWRKFPNVTHVLAIDPDWEPVSAPKADLADFSHRNYAFLVWDRNGLTTRSLNWLVRHERGLRFSHRLHEQLVLPENTGGAALGIKAVSWEMREVEVLGRKSWHTTVEHGHSQSYRRYMRDLELLQEDLIELGPDDSHTQYYIGATHLSAIDALLGIGVHERTPEVEHHIDMAIRHLESRALMRDRETGRSEDTWAAMRWLAYALQYYARGDHSSAAQKWYEECVDYDKNRCDCSVFLAKLHRDSGHHARAWVALLPALQLERGEAAARRSVAHNFYVQNCSLPLEAALALLPILAVPAAEIARDANFRVMLLLATAFLDTARAACSDTTRGFITARPADVAAAAEALDGLFRELPAELSGACVPRHEAFTAADANEAHFQMMLSWGLPVCGDNLNPSRAIPSREL